MDDLQVSGRSSAASARPKPKTKALGINFSQRKANRSKASEQKALSQSKDSGASTTYLTSPSGANQTGNPLLSTEDVLQRLSKSLPPSDSYSFENDAPVKESVKDSIVMRPDFTQKAELPGGRLFVHRLDNAANLIQQQWRVYLERKSAKSYKMREVKGLKMSDSLKQMLEMEKAKMLAERDKEKIAEKKNRSELEDKKRQARLKAIEDLNKKREEKRKLQQQIIDEELKLAAEQASKKKKKPRDKTTSVKFESRTGDKHSPGKSIKKSAEDERSTKDILLYGDNSDTIDNGTSDAKDSTYNELIDEIFLTNRNITKADAESEIDTPRVGWGTPLRHKSPLPSDRLQNDDDASVKEKKRAYSSLMETLKMLEAESDEVLSETKSSSIVIPPTPKLTQGEVYRLDRLGASELHTTGIMPSGKIKNLLQFLENVDATSPSEDTQSYSSAGGLERARFHSAAAEERERLRNVSAAVEEVTENVRATQDQLSNKAEQLEFLKTELSSTTSKTAHLQAQVFATKLESDEKGKAVLMLQRALDEQRDLTLRLTTEQEKDAQQRLANQKTEYETTIQRHLAFIDQLIADKKQLSDKVECLVTQLRTTEKRLGDKIKLLEDNQRVDIKRQKEAIEAAEKIKRERWIADKSIQIKEMTVKGLEPEIQKLISKNKAEMKRLKAVHEADLLAADERASKRFVAQVEELREQLDQEKEAACARERDHAQKRYQKQVEQEEEAYQQQRRRLYAEVQEEKDRVAESLNKQRAELELERKGTEEENNTKCAKLQAQHTIEIEGIHREHANQMRDIKLRIQVEKEQWLESQNQKQSSELKSRERDIRATLREERNKEIELVIRKLEEQSAVQREEAEADLQSRMRRLKDKYENQIADLEHINNTTQSKLNVMKERITDVEADNIRLRGGIKTIERKNEDIEKVSSRLKAERDKVEEVIREEFSERLVHLDEENKTVKAANIESRTRHKLELERVGKAHESEMEDVQSRITSAFAKRDEVIKDLRDKHGSASSRADHLETLLIKQREELLRPHKKL